MLMLKRQLQSGDQTSALHARNRHGFTLTELLVVIAIVLTLAIVTVPVALQMNDGRRLRDTSRTLQAVFAGARERAMASRAPVGVRLIPDTNDPSIVRSLQFIEQSPPFTLGKAMVVHSAWPNAVAAGTTPIIDTIILLGMDAQAVEILRNALPTYKDGTDIYYFGSIRLGGAGAPMTFTSLKATTGFDFVDGGTPYPKLTLYSPLTLPIPFGTSVNLNAPVAPAVLADQPWHPSNTSFTADPTSVGMDFKIPLGNRVRSGEEPILLPSGIVIDLGYIPPAGGTVDPNPPEQRLSRLRHSFFDKSNPEKSHWDIVMSPAGRVIGDAAAESQIVLWLREETAGITNYKFANASATTIANGGTADTNAKLVRKVSPGNHALLAIFTKTGRVQSSNPDFKVDTTFAADGAGYFDSRRYYDFVSGGNSGGL